MKEYKELLPEITLKYKKQAGVKKVSLSNSSDANVLFRTFYDEDTIELCESAIILFLNNQHKSIGWYKVSQGGMTETLIDIRLILATALGCGAVSLMLSHNHPSGNIVPSSSDDNMTRKLSDACKLLDMRLIDHVIVSGDSSSYYSYADEGKLY